MRIQFIKLSFWVDNAHHMPQDSSLREVRVYVTSVFLQLGVDLVHCQDYILLGKHKMKDSQNSFYFIDAHVT